MAAPHKKERSVVKAGSSVTFPFESERLNNYWGEVNSFPKLLSGPEFTAALLSKQNCEMDWRNAAGAGEVVYPRVADSCAITIDEPLATDSA